MKSTARTDILFVVRRGNCDPASRKRVYELLPLFERRGYRCRVLSVDWELLWDVRMRVQAGSRPLRYLLYALNAARITPRLIAARDRRNHRRFATLVESSDVVVVNQSTLGEEWRDLLRTHARHVVYEFDDAVWLYDEAAVGEMIELASTVVAGNSFLADYARERHDDVVVIPTAVRLDRYEATSRTGERPGAPFTIGWVGSSSTTKYLTLLEEPLARLGAERSVALEIVGSGTAPLPSFRNVEVRLHPRIPYDPIRYVPGFDVGVMPLFDGEAERGKCGAKALEYMAAGVPAVCSAVGANAEIVENGVSGFLVDDQDSWLDALRTLAGDPLLRRRVGDAGRERVRERYSAEMVVGTWDACLRERLGVERPRVQARSTRVSG